MYSQAYSSEIIDKIQDSFWDSNMNDMCFVDCHRENMEIYGTYAHIDRYLMTIECDQICGP